MFQVLEQTRDEKFTMYLKLTKSELAIMLIESNEMVKAMVEQAEVSAHPLVTYTPPHPKPTWIFGPTS